MFQWLLLPMTRALITEYPIYPETPCFLWSQTPSHPTSLYHPGSLSGQVRIPGSADTTHKVWDCAVGTISLYTSLHHGRILLVTIMDMPLAWMRTDSSLPKLEVRKQVLDPPKHIWLLLWTHGGFNLKDTAKTLPLEPLHSLCALSPVTGRGFFFPWGWDSSSYPASLSIMA